MKLTLLLLMGTLCTAQRPLLIRIYNLADVPPASLNRAIAVAAHVLVSGGISPAWQEGLPNDPEGHLTSFITVSSSNRRLMEPREFVVLAITMGPPRKVWPAITGYALPFANQGANAIVFYDRVGELTKCSTRPVLDVGTVLGAVMAHEIGHVVMGSIQHSAHGIMKQKWGPDELRLLTCDYLQFTDADKKRIAHSDEPGRRAP